MESSSDPGGGGTSQGIGIFGNLGTHRHSYGIVIVMLVIIALLAAILAANGVWTKSLPISTIMNETLSAGYVHETGYYTDELGWMEGQGHLVSELKNYYKLTGVQPYVYIAGTIDGSVNPSASDLFAYTDRLYDQLFTEEGHILLFYFQSGDRYMTRYVMGDAAKTVVSTKAADDLLYAVSQFIKPDQK